MTNSPPDNKTEQAWFRCAPDLLAWIDEQAENEGRTRSSMIDRLLWRAMVLSEKEKVEVKDWACSGCDEVFKTELGALSHLLDEHPRVSIEDENERRSKLQARIDQLLP